MIELKLRKFGNSLGVVLRKEALARMNVGEHERLFLTEPPDGGYRLTPFDPAFERKVAAAESIIRRYRSALSALTRAAP